jgi:hypothetical protein
MQCTINRLNQQAADQGLDASHETVSAQLHLLVCLKQSVLAWGGMHMLQPQHGTAQP